MNEPIFRANRGLPRFERPANASGAGFSHIGAAILTEQQAYANAATMDDLAAKAEAAGHIDIAAGYRRSARAERAAGRAAVSQYLPSKPSTFDAPPVPRISGQLSLGV